MPPRRRRRLAFQPGLPVWIIPTGGYYYRKPRHTGRLGFSFQARLPPAAARQRHAQLPARRRQGRLPCLKKIMSARQSAWQALQPRRL